MKVICSCGFPVLLDVDMRPPAPLALSQTVKLSQITCNITLLTREPCEISLIVIFIFLRSKKIIDFFFTKIKYFLKTYISAIKPNLKRNFMTVQDTRVFDKLSLNTKSKIQKYNFCRNFFFFLFLIDIFPEILKAVLV